MFVADPLTTDHVRALVADPTLGRHSEIVLGGGCVGYPDLGGGGGIGGRRGTNGGPGDVIR